LAARVDVSWDICYLHVNRVGEGTRLAIGANGKLPIPPVYMTRGDTLYLHVHNSLNVSTTVHAHGIFQNGTVYNDGTAMITECSIPPGDNHTYIIAPEQEGTFWLHGHYDEDNADGLRAALIIYEKEPIVDYDAEYLFAVEDWYSTEFIERMKQIVHTGITGNLPITYSRALINGDLGNFTKPIKFEPSKKYRIRFINMAATNWFKISMPGHKMQIIEIEGVHSVPYDVDQFDVGPGQRISVLVEAKDTDEFNYNYNITLYLIDNSFVSGANPLYYSGLIEYRENAPVYQSPPIEDNYQWAEDINMNAFDGEPLLEPVTRKIVLNYQQKILSDGLPHYLLGDHPYQSPLVPTLFTALTMGDLATDPAIYGPQTVAYVLDHMDIVEIELHNPGSPDHTFHLHGHTFQIIEYGPTNATSEDNSTEIAVRKSAGAPMRRDTLMVRAWNYVKVRFRADSPGVWFFHCHMSTHLYLGLAVTFVEAPLLLQKQIQVPDEYYKMCQKQSIKTSGNGAGN
ncbi:Cupredoxin, partial [Coemansia spiralis]